MYYLFVGVSYGHYVACFLPVIITAAILYSINYRLDKEEAAFEKAFPRIPESSSSSFRGGKHDGESLLASDE